MRIGLPIVVLALSICAVARASEDPSFTPISEEEAAELMEGDVLLELERGSPLRAQAIALIHAPMRELGEIIADYDAATEWAPALSEQYVVEREGENYILQATTAIPWPISDRHFRMRSHWEFTTFDGSDAFIDRFEYIEGSGNLDDSFGYWLMMPYADNPEYTYIKYVVNADPGIAVPPFIIRWVTRNAVPDLFEALAERHAEVY